MVVKKEAEHPRILPSLEHMKIVSLNSNNKSAIFAKIKPTVYRIHLNLIKLSNNSI